MAAGGHLENLFYASSPEPKGQLTWNLVRSIKVTCRSKIAKIVSIQNQDQLTWNLVGSIGVTCRSKQLKSSQSKIQGGRRGSHLKNLFFTSPPEPKSLLTWNLVRSHAVTCRSKIDKIVSIGNSRWLQWRPSWTSIFRFFSWTERPIDFKIGMKHKGDL